MIHKISVTKSCLISSKSTVKINNAKIISFLQDKALKPTKTYWMLQNPYAISKLENTMVSDLKKFQSIKKEILAQTNSKTLSEAESILSEFSDKLKKLTNLTKSPSLLSFFEYNEPSNLNPVQLFSSLLLGISDIPSKSRDAYRKILIMIKAMCLLSNKIDIERSIKNALSSLMQQISRKDLIFYPAFFFNEATPEEIIKVGYILEQAAKLENIMTIKNVFFLTSADFVQNKLAQIISNNIYIYSSALDKRSIPAPISESDILI